MIGRDDDDDDDGSDEEEDDDIGEVFKVHHLYDLNVKPIFIPGGNKSKDPKMSRGTIGALFNCSHIWKGPFLNSINWPVIFSGFDVVVITAYIRQIDSYNR